MKLPKLPEGAGYYTVEQLAEFFQCNVQTVRNWCRSGSLEALKIGDLWRIPPESLEAFITKSKEDGRPKTK